MPEGWLAGAYTTIRDGGMTYSYEVNWRRIDNSAIWTATVRRQGRIAGMPGGTILNVQGVDVEANVTALVEAAIERKQGVA